MHRVNDHPHVRPKKEGGGVGRKRGPGRKLRGKGGSFRTAEAGGGGFGQGWVVSSPPWPGAAEQDEGGKSYYIWLRRFGSPFGRDVVE